MKVKQVEEILDRIVAFANYSQREKLSKALFSLMGFSLMRGVGFAPNRRLDILLSQDLSISDEELELAKPIAVQHAVRDTLEIMVTGGAVDVSLRGKITTRVEEDGSVDLYLSVPDEEGDDYIVAKIMAHLMLFSGVKAVRKCTGCGNFMLLRKTTIKKTCGNTCRQRVYQEGLTWKQKREQAMRRSKASQRKQKERDAN